MEKNLLFFSSFFDDYSVITHPIKMKIDEDIKGHFVQDLTSSDFSNIIFFETYKQNSKLLTEKMQYFQFIIRSLNDSTSDKDEIWQGHKGRSCT